MPNKTIYVADRDLPLYDRAQELAGGNLSSAISQALQRFVDVREAVERGLQEVTVAVGPAGLRTKKRFVGRAVARWQGRADHGIVERYVVYRTARGRFAVHVRRDWSPGPLPFEADVDLPAPGGPAAQSRMYTLAVYDTLEELRAQLPTELADLIDQYATIPEVEDLDI